MPHVAWKGHLRLSLVAIPVRAYTASRSGQNPISLNQLHSECHIRIRYKKTCPVHGEVPANEIVMGYEFAKDEYVVIDPDELDQLRTEANKSINVAEFVPPQSIDPNHFSGRAYYLLPDGNVGDRPYALVRQAMSDKGLCAVGQVVITSREHLVAVRPLGKLLVMNLLEYASQIKQSDEFEDDAPEPALKKEELKLTGMLIEAMEQPTANLEQFQDVYYDKLQQLIDAKVSGQDVVSPPESAPPVRAINFIDALKASMKQVKTPRATRKSAARKTGSGHSSVLREAKKSVASRKRRKSG
jgi:DNA end-binding protein Ku